MPDKVQSNDIRIDSFLNLLAGIGGSQDKTINTTIGAYSVLTDQELRDLWMGDGFGKRIVSVVADDMTRSGFTIPEDVNNKAQEKLFELDYETELNSALKWMRLFGGSAILIGAKDGKKLEEPLQVNRIQDIQYLKTYSKDQIVLNETNIIIDPNNPDFGELETFEIQPKYGSTFKVHSSRLLLFKGELAPTNATNDAWMQYWGMSVLQSIWDQLKNLGVSQQGMGNLLMELVIGKYKLHGLANMMAQGEEKKVQARLEIINLSKSVINGILLDESEDYIRDSISLTGAAEVLDRMMMFLSGVSEIPVTKLYGRSPAGENATGDYDARNYYDMVRANQRIKALKPTMRLVNLMNNFLKIVPKKEMLTVQFNPLMEPTPEQAMALKKSQAEIDKIYITDTGVLTGEEVRENRFEGGYSFETVIEEPEEYEEPEEPETNPDPDIPEEEEDPEETEDGKRGFLRRKRNKRG